MTSGQAPGAGQARRCPNCCPGRSGSPQSGLHHSLFRHLAPWTTTAATASPPWSSTAGERALHSRACEVAGGRGARLCAASCGSCEQHRRGPPPTRAAARRARLRLRDPLRGALCVVRISDVLHRTSANSCCVGPQTAACPDHHDLGHLRSCVSLADCCQLWQMERYLAETSKDELQKISKFLAKLPG